MTAVSREWIEFGALAIEALAVALILVAVVYGTGRFLLHLHRRVDDAYKQFKTHLGKALLLGLEFLVAADIVRTVALEPTLTNVGMLGVLVVVRTFLSWSLVVEIEGRWPWQADKGTGVAREAGAEAPPASLLREEAWEQR
jgi:uncharacterized membrane protein